MKSRQTIRTIVEIALFAAIGYILDEIQGVFAVSFTSGGSIGFAMVPVIIIGYRRGGVASVLTGLIMGMLDFCTKAYIIHPVQPLLDYILPYALVGVAGFFKPLFDHAKSKGLKVMWITIAGVVGGLLKFTSHFFAGAIFWNEAAYFAWGLTYLNPWVYSLVYNMAYIGPCIVISIAVCILLFLRAPVIFTAKDNISKEKGEVNKKPMEIAFEAFFFIGGTVLFIYFLISYIQSFVWKESSQKFSFDRDSLVLFLCGLAIMGLSITYFIKTLKNKFILRRFFLEYGIISLLVFGYSLARIIDMYIDPEGVIENKYWIWFALNLFTTFACGTIYTLLFIRYKKSKTLSNQ